VNILDYFEITADLVVTKAAPDEDEPKQDEETKKEESE
jgi:hypothetical protein